MRLIRKAPWETSWCTLTTNAVSVTRFICIAHCGFLLPAPGPQKLRVGRTDQPARRLAHAEKESVGGFSRGGCRNEISDKVEDRDCHAVAEFCSLRRRFSGMRFGRTQIQAESQTNFSARKSLLRCPCDNRRFDGCCFTHGSILDAADFSGL